MCGSTSAGSCPRTKAGSSPRSWKASSPATSNTISPRRWKSSSTASPTTRSTGAAAARFLARFHRRVDDIKDLRIGEVLDALDDDAGAARVPAARGRRRPAPCPTCGTGRLSIKLGKFGAFIGCSNYPECRYTRQFAASARGDARGRQRQRVLGKDPDTGLEVTLRAGRFGPYMQLGEGAEGEKPKRASIPKGAIARRHRSRAGAGAALAAARGRQASRKRRADHGRDRPLRPLCPAREDLRQPRTRRRRAQHRPQPRRRP